METKGIDLTKCKNLKFKAKIDGTPCGGTIQVENGNVYLCQNDKKGANCDDKLGFKYSWCIRQGSPDDMKKFDINVTDFEIVPRDPERYQDWQVGDIVARNDKTKRTKEVIFRSGELVVCKNADGDIDGGYTCGQLHRLGFRLVLTDIERQIIEERKWEPHDGDVCYTENKDGYCTPFIYRREGQNRTAFYVALDKWGNVLIYHGCAISNENIKMLRPATDEEKQRLFDAIAKEGKRWNAEKKVVEDIPKPHEFKKSEPVLARSGASSKWCICAYVQAEGTMTKVFVGEIEAFFNEVIPYNEKTMHLLGTTEDYREE